MSETLDPLGIPLSGLHLIEASAGTGKTYTIAQLVLRLVVETGLSLEQILVLTFTEAATEELRERIARRLRQALEALNGSPTKDTLLSAWVASRPEPDLAKARLEAALAGLDLAAIHTIHGFCQRVLRDFAFESGTPFDTELITDERDLRRAAAEDFWRRRVAPAGRAEAAWMLEELPEGPESLLDLLKASLGSAPPQLVELDREGLIRGLAAVDDLHRRLAEAWPIARPDMSALLLDGGALKGNVYRLSAVDRAIAEMDALCDGPPPSKVPEKLALFTPGKLEASTKKGHTTPTHPFFALCGELAALDLPGLARTRRAVLLGNALAFLREELRRRKRERRVTYFDDLLSETAEALAGPRGPALAEGIRARFPQALVDEFQDTDRLQYRIIESVYGDALTGDPALGLYLIGDPKQAIYGFRGADIFTYIAARRQARDRGRIHTLDTNRRSASGLVEAVNRLFGRVRAPFIYEGDIDFEPVRPGPDADREPLRIGGVEAPPLVFRWLPLAEDRATRDGRRLLADPARELAVKDCAREIARLLAAPARLGDQALRARDIAVLVRSHRDGLAVREALAGVGVGSVSIGQESVFETEEAEDLAALIAALGPGCGDGTLRRALATRSLGWSAARLAALDATGGGDPAPWDRVLRDFETYRVLWQERGFMAAMGALLHGLGVPARLRRGPEGERRLTNLLHLVELAQEASREHLGPDALGRWLADRRSQPGAGGDAALLRLESDENLVQLVTFHKSKGLEYPVVFIPIPWSKGPLPDPRDPVAFHDPETLEPWLDLGSPCQDDHRTLAEREDLAERLRLLYVALTRAKRQCVVHWGAVNQAEGSAAGYLLHQGPEGEPAAQRMPGLAAAELRGDLEALARSAPGAIAVEDLGGEDRTDGTPTPGGTEDLRPAQFRGSIPADWRILSFSALAAGQGQGPERPDHDALAEPRPGAADETSALGGGEPVDAEGPRPGDAAEAIEPIFRFPRGVRAGHCLHDLFEHLDFCEAEGPGLEREARAALARHGIEDLWTPTLVELVGRVLDTPLTREGLRLRGLGPEDRRSELEFHFSLRGLRTDALGRVLADHGLPAQVSLPTDRPTGSLEGLMKGFVDLVLRHQGRFYVLDYKSNHLGDRPEDYGPVQIARAMTEHRYHLQSLIYTVALHRYLRGRLPGYDPGRHLGGSLYLFVRGMRPELGPERGVFRSRPSPALIQDLDRILGGSEGPRP